DDDNDYYSESKTCVERMNLAGKGSKVFIGLYSSPDGGTCFANGSGCGIKDITEDITLYAFRFVVGAHGSKTYDVNLDRVYLTSER
ncbi:MAG: hypothetical protein IKW66_05035, partial [Clostridia bacterium]|nr:hypothetical protein [Clostridia bacterium]